MTVDERIYTIRRNIQRLMEKNSISQYALAKRTGVSQPTICNLVSLEQKENIRNPNIKTLFLIADGLGVKLEELLK